MVRRVLIIVSALLFVGIIGAVQEYEAQQSSSSPSASQPSSSSEGTPVNKPSQPVESASVENERQGGNSDHLTRSEQYALWINLALLIVVALQVWIAFRQNKIADHQRQIMEQQIKMSETIERGYMGIADMSISNLIVGGRPTVTVKWVNGGRTPVRNFRAKPIVVFGTQPVSKKMYFIDDDVSPISGSFFPVGAEREVEYEAPDRIEADEWSEFGRGKSNLYIIGNFFYRDITGAKQTGRISAMYDRHKEFVYETYAYSDPDDPD